MVGTGVSSLAVATGLDFAISTSAAVGCGGDLEAFPPSTVLSVTDFSFTSADGVEGAGTGVAGFDAAVADGGGLAFLAISHTSLTGFAGVSAAAFDTTCIFAFMFLT